MMLNKFSIAASLAGTLLISFATTQAAQAGTFYQGWNYSIDATGDGSGGSVYDIKGLAIKQTDTDIYIAISSNLALTGVTDNRAANHNIGWGDLFFDFSGGTFNQANANKSLFGIRFAGTNDSDVSQVGVYSTVAAKSVTQQNIGYSSIKQYHDQGWFKANTMGQDLATKTDVYQYFAGNTTGQDTTINNVIDEGTYLGGLTFLNDQETLDSGLDFSHFNALGNQVFAFKFDRNFLPSQQFVASVFLECGNDGIGIKGEFDTPPQLPEPSAMGGLTLLGLVVGHRRMRRKALS
jgi:hypothetical protein